MSLNKALHAMLARSGKPVHYREDNRMKTSSGLITPCTGNEIAGIRPGLYGTPQENRYVYISVSGKRPPAAGTMLYSGGASYLVEESGAVSAGKAIEYVWALLRETEEER